MNIIKVIVDLVIYLQKSCIFPNIKFNWMTEYWYIVQNVLQNTSILNFHYLFNTVNLNFVRLKDPFNDPSWTLFNRITGEQWLNIQPWCPRVRVRIGGTTPEQGCNFLMGFVISEHATPRE